MGRQFPCTFAVLEGRRDEERGGAVDSELQHLEGWVFLNRQEENT